MATPSSTSAPAPALRVVQLQVSRGGHPVLSDLSFDVAPGEIFALIGGNGAGKSTTLLCCLGLLQADSGRVEINGACVATDPERARASTAYLSENAMLYDHLSARENLYYFLRLAGMQPDDAAIDGALTTAGLQRDAWERRTTGFSKGMRQKVAIALALLRRTPLLLLDEPTSGLDPLAIEDFNHLLLQLRDQGVAILMVTHDLPSACEVASRVVLLREGRLVASFTADTADGIELPAVKRAFAGAA